MLISNREAKWVNQMQPTLSDRTKATNVTRVLGYFRIKENDVKHTLLNEERSPIKRKHGCHTNQPIEHTQEAS